jgi:hypothetical protein|tara:strand:- start:8797 stop:10497 length:1701 start_codon:yes stop_codon:yes gene_type:complete
MRKILLLLLIFISSEKYTLYAQDYINPLDFRLLLSGSFGELRSNHFHTGIDIKTKGVEGQKVYAIADGYITRIKVSSYGYGKAIYINHKDGRTSVYAHLSEFSDKIDSITKKEHYRKKSFEINIYPEKNTLNIKQGDIIALSGNSGSSGGAHLHFEIRDTKTEQPLNPLDYGFKVQDIISPIIKELKVFTIENAIKRDNIYNNIYKVRKNNQDYIIDSTININKKTGLAIYTYDQSNDAYNKNGVNSIKVFIDSTLIYFFKLDRLDFNKNKYINAHIDYKEKKNSKRKFHKCFKLPNNSLKNYKEIIDNGFIKLPDNNIHSVRIEVGDSYNNISNLSFNIRLKNSKQNKKTNNIIESENRTKLFAWNKENEFEDENFKISLKERSLYETINFNYKKKDSINGIYGNIHQCHYNYVPLHKPANISIKSKVPNELKEKAYIAKIRDKKYNYIGGNWQNNYITGKSNELGDFAIVIDTLKPIIKGVNIYPEKKLKNQKTIKCTIEDKESGIKKYTAILNNQWILMDYDYKRKLLKYEFDNIIKKGSNTFSLTVTDKVGNTTNYSVKFTY